MYKQVEKNKENKNSAVANSVAQKKGDGRQGFGFLDNRTESIAQGKMQEIPQNNFQSIRTVQLLANNHSLKIDSRSMNCSQHNQAMNQGVVQCYQISKVPYDSNEASLVVRERESNNHWVHQVNYGSLSDGNGDLVMQSGIFHSEKLLIGNKVREAGKSNSDDPDELAKLYKTLPGRGVAKLYTERNPCPPCDRVLTLALNSDDKVYYTVPYGNNEALENEIWEYRHKSDFEAQREIENEQYEKDNDEAEFIDRCWRESWSYRGGVPEYPNYYDVLELQGYNYETLTNWKQSLMDVAREITSGEEVILQCFVHKDIFSWLQTRGMGSAEWMVKMGY